MKKTKRDFKMLPHYFKIIAIVLFVLSIGLIFVLKAISVSKALSFELSADGVFLLLLIFALSKEKREDEWVQRVRLLAFSGAFIGGVVFFLVESIIRLLFDFGTSPGTRLFIFTLFAFYFLFFYLAKRRHK